MTRFLVVTLLLVACQDDIQPVLSETVDADNDGFSETEDCDDAEPRTHPDAVEICDDIDNNCNGEIDEGEPYNASTWYLDADGDGYGTPDASIRACNWPSGYADNPRDCNDESADANPAGVESCDGLDNDCDSIVDEGTSWDAPTWYEDADGDGYGSPYTTWSSCEQPSGFVADGTDCDDEDADINPGAAEVCAGWVDEDCDQDYDDYDSDVSDPLDWYADEDSDGYGDPSTHVTACDQPSGYVGNGEDCDGTTATANPGAAEVCANEIDDDCDGDIDEEDAPYPVQWYRDVDGDGYGDSRYAGTIACGSVSGYAPNAEDCNDYSASTHPDATETWYDGTDQNCQGDDDYDADADGYKAESSGGSDCNDTTERAHPGLVEVCGDGLDNDCDDETDPCDLDAEFMSPNAGDAVGGALAGIGDWNGDGNVDLAFGADRYDGSGTSMGIAWLVLGPVSGRHNLEIRAKASFTGEADNDRAAGAVTGTVDIDGDGYADMAIGALGEDTGGTSAGAVYIVGGPGLGDDSLSDADAKLTGELPYDYAGSALAGGGDLSGDGFVDLLVAAPGQDAGGSAAGAVYLVSGPITADLDLSYADVRVVGADSGDEAGTSLAGDGDVNGDGVDDLLVGAPYAQADGAWVGSAYVIEGPLVANQVSVTEAESTIVGAASGDLLGWAVAWAGDTDGDGLDDVVVGAPGVEADASAAGAVYVIVADDLRSGETATTSLKSAVLADGEHEYLGNAVAGIGDFDRDGKDDVVAGSRLSDDSGYTDAGAAYIMLGPIDGKLTTSDLAARVLGEYNSDWAGYAVAGAGDVDGDRYHDILVGVPFSDDLDVDAGKAWLILGDAW